MKHSPPALTWEKYSARFREDAHQLLAWGYKDAFPLIKARQEETEITGYVAEAIDARLSADVSVTPKRFNRYCLKEDNPTKAGELKGKRRRRLDIVVEMTSRRPRPHYVFEAKRLHTSGHPISTYLGDKGLLRFVERRYAADCPEAAMVGYVQNNTAKYWKDKLNESFDKDMAGHFCVERELRKEVILADLPDEWVSIHRRAGSPCITIYHIFLDCTAP